MGRVSFRLDRAGIGRIAKSAEVRRALHHFADPMAEAAKSNTEAVVGEPVDVVLVDRTTDRAVVVVDVRHPGALAAQFKHGALTRAAAGQGLDVTER